MALHPFGEVNELAALGFPLDDVAGVIPGHVLPLPFLPFPFDSVLAHHVGVKWAARLVFWRTGCEPPCPLYPLACHVLPPSWECTPLATVAFDTVRPASCSARANAIFDAAEPL